MSATERDLDTGRRIANNARYLNMHVAIAAAIADERERVLNLARKVIETETSAYPDASPAVLAGIEGGFDQWAAACIDGLEMDPAEQTHRFDCTCGCSWGAHRADGSCEDCGCLKFAEDTCKCAGLSHRHDCPQWVSPK